MKTKTSLMRTFTSTEAHGNHARVAGSGERKRLR